MLWLLAIHYIPPSCLQYPPAFYTLRSTPLVCHVPSFALVTAVCSTSWSLLFLLVFMSATVSSQLDILTLINSLNAFICCDPILSHSQSPRVPDSWVCPVPPSANHVAHGTINPSIITVTPTTYRHFMASYINHDYCKYDHYILPGSIVIAGRKR